MARFMLNPKIVLSQYDSLKPLGDVWYNLKTNPDVGKILEERTNANLVATGLRNLERIKNKKRASVLIQGETVNELKTMVDLGVNWFIIDNKRDLEKIQSVTDTSNILLRIKIKEHSVYTGKYFVYGFDWREAVKIAKSVKGNVGIHFHRKTQNVGEWSLIDDLTPVIKGLEGVVNFVNIGGGIPSTYYNSKPEFKPIFEKILNFKNNLKEKGIQLQLEPGRYIAAPSVKLETNVILAYDKNLVVDASIYNAYMDTFLFNVRLSVEGESEIGHRYLIKGKSPDSVDIFRYKIFFTEQKSEGDKIIFLNAGAYNFHTNFADMEKIKTVLLD